MSPVEASPGSVDPGIVAAQRALAPLLQAIDPAIHSVKEMRARAERSALTWADGLPHIAEVAELAIDVSERTIRARWFDPRANHEPAHAFGGAILFLHGGGWTIGSIDTHDRLMRCIAAEARCPVLGIDYRLSPEHAFPAALEDARAALAWLGANAGVLGFHAGRIALAGDSAGANIALATALAQRDAAVAGPVALALFYPCLAPDFATASYAASGDGRFGLTTERMRYYWANYLGEKSISPPPLSAPLSANLQGMPPVFIGYAECDPLADDSIGLAEALAKVEVPHQLVCWKGAVHGFMQMTRDVPLARAAVAQSVGWLRSFVD